jgi:hypothetical protein
MFAYEPLGLGREYCIAVQQHIKVGNEFKVDVNQKDAPIYQINDDETLLAAHY